MNKNNKVDIEEIKNYLLEQIKINNSDIDRNIEKIRKENSVENLKNALQYFRKLVDSFGSYIYIKDNNVEEKFNKEKIWNKAKNWIKHQPDYKFLTSFYDDLSKNIVHSAKSNDTSERLFFYFLNYLSEIKEIAWNRFSLKLIENFDILNEYVISNVKEYNKKIADKLDEQIKNNTKTASIFIIDKTPIFWKKKNGLYYKVTFSTIEEYNLDYRNKKNNIIAYSKIDFKLGYFSKISYIEDSIEIQDRQLNFYIITAYEIVIQESDIKYFINTIKKNKKFR
ncbi:helicase [Mesomycoplasma hyorhinis]|uniref:helicase n=1 Tax=Mesomycoplasma hyorhinis TaxID=2100 RepID=UPI0003153ACB